MVGKKNCENLASRFLLDKETDCLGRKTDTQKAKNKELNNKTLKIPNQILNQTKLSREEQELPSLHEGTDMGSSQFV